MEFGYDLNDGDPNKPPEQLLMEAAAGLVALVIVVGILYFLK